MMYKQSKPAASGEMLIRDLRYLGSVVNQCFSSLGVLVQLGTLWATTRGHLDRVATLIDYLEFSQSGETVVWSATPAPQAQSGVIELMDVDVVPPSGNMLLVKNLHFKLDSHNEKGLMLAGCNGSGKSSVMKCMSGLIPPSKGIVLSKPTEVHYVPTKPYLAEGCIADQVTYPFEATKEADYVEIMAVLKKVKVAYLDERGGGVFSTISDSWDSKLSLGEQQRIAIARLLFREKRSAYKFAFLDECTSAVALDGEEEMYREIAGRGLCCVTASQKPWLLQFHSKIVQLTEGSSWDLALAPTEAGASATPARLPDIVYNDARQQVAGGIITEEPNGIVEANEDTSPADNTKDQLKVGNSSNKKNKRRGSK